jgi:hypothetical protein
MNERDKQKSGQPEASEDELDWDSPPEDEAPPGAAPTRPKRDSFIPLPQGFRQRRRDSETSGLDWNAKPPVRESSPPLRPPSRPPVGRAEPVAKPVTPAKPAKPVEVPKPAAKPSAVAAPPRVVKAVDAPRAAEASRVSGDKIKPLESRPIRAVSAPVEAVAEPRPEPKPPVEPPLEPKPIVPPRTLTPILGLAPARQPQLIYSQAGNPTPEMPIVYRERAYYVDSLLGDDELRDNLLRELGSLKEELRGWEQVKYVQLALFDHKFQRQPSGPPLATLSWKDWQSEPEIWVRGARRSGPPPEAGPSESRPNWDLNLDAYGPGTDRGIAAEQQPDPEPLELPPLEPTAPVDLRAPAEPEPIAALESSARPEPEASAQPEPVAQPEREPESVAEPELIEEPEPIAAAPARVPRSPAPLRPRSMPPRPKTERPVSAPPIELSITDAPFSDDELLEKPSRSSPPARARSSPPRRPLRSSTKPPARRSRAPREPELIEPEPESLDPELLQESPPLAEGDAHDERNGSDEALDDTAPAEALATHEPVADEPTADEPVADGEPDEAAHTRDAAPPDVLDELHEPEGTPQAGFPAPAASEEADESSPMPLVRRRTSLPAPLNDIDELEPYEGTRAPEPSPTPVTRVREEVPIPLVSIRPSRPVSPSTAPRAVEASTETDDDELLGALFERMHELLYVPSITAGADFVLDVLAEKMPCEGAIVHVFDRNDRSFLVVRARGPNSARIVLSRTPENDPRLGEVLRRARSTPSTPPPDPSAASRPSVSTATLWTRLGVQPRHTLAGPALHERAYVGMIELCNPTSGRPFRESESVALDYVLEQFADFVVKRAAELD